MPVPNRYLSSLLINYRGRKILIDCGEGTQVSMKIANCGFKTIDYICITHLHGDHIIGLPGILSTIGNCGRTEMLTIIGPKGI
ncbi:MAG: MBL fold metallo-hydrolase, partial [Paraclostridium dentum]